MRLQFRVSKNKKSKLVGEDSVAFWNLKTRSTEDFASGLGGASNSGVERAIKWSEDFWVRKIFVGGREFVGLRKISLHFTSEIQKEWSSLASSRISPCSPCSHARVSKVV